MTVDTHVGLLEQFFIPKCWVNYVYSAYINFHDMTVNDSVRIFSHIQVSCGVETVGLC